jgi:mannosyltransferase
MTGLAALLRLTTIDNASLWFDEALTLSLVRMDLGGMLGQLPDSEANPPLYYVLAWGWARVFGVGEVDVRALSALAGVITVPVAYAAAARLATPRVGLLVAAFAAVSPLLVWHSQDARAYSVLVLLASLSLLTFARALADARDRELGAWAVTAALALATHYFAVFLVAGQALWLFAGHPRRRAVVTAVGAVGIGGLGLLPLALHQMANGGATWLAERQLADRVASLGPHFLVGYAADPGPLASYESGVPAALIIAAGTLVAAALVMALAFVARRGRTESDAPEGRERRAFLLAAVLSLAAGGLPLLLALAGPDYVSTRNLLPAWLALSFLVGVGLGSRRAGKAGVLIAIALCCVLTAVTSFGAASPRFGPDDWLSVARALGGPRSPRAVMAPASISMPLALERPGLRTMPARGARVQEIDVLRRGGTRRRSPDHGFRLVDRRVVGGSYTLFRFRSPQPALVTPGRLLGDSPIRGRRTAVLLAPSVTALGARRSEPPSVSFCEPPAGEKRSRVSIRTTCAAAYPGSER